MRSFQPLWKRVYASFIGALLKLRYRIVVEEEGALCFDTDQGILFLSNHVAEIDPVIVESVLWPRFYTRPLAVDYLFKNSLVRWFLNSVGAIPVPSVVPGKNPEKTKMLVGEFYRCSADVLDKKESLLLYPSGRLSRSGKEEIVNQYSAYVLLQKVKECNVCLVRISGLWGSSFSRYNRNSSPKLGETFKKAFMALLRKGIFFMPRRRVKITLKQVDYAFLKQFETRQDLNSFLSSWFNQEEHEDFPVEVPYL